MLTRRELLVAAACLTTRSVPAMAEEQNVLKLLIPDGSQDNLAPVIAMWEAQTGIQVAVDIAGVDEINDRMTVDHIAGRANYDLALPATFGIPDLAWSEVIRPLDGLAEETLQTAGRGIYEQGDFVDGRRYGAQTDGDVYLMFYRRDWLEDADTRARYGDLHGQDLAIPATWAELDRQLRFFHAPEERRHGGLLFRHPGYMQWEFWSRMHANGVLPFDADLRPQLAEPGAIAALEEMIAASEYLHPGARAAALFDNWKLFAEGETYCNIGWGGSQKYFHKGGSAVRGKLAHGLLPGGIRPSVSYFNWGWSYVIPANSARPDLAARFAAFATGPEASTAAVREAGGYFDPFHASHYDDPIIRETYSDDFLAVHRRAFDDPLPDLYLPGHGSYFGKLSQRLNEAYTGEKTPKEALEHAARDWELISLDFGREAQAERWAAARQTYPAAFLSASGDG